MSIWLLLILTAILFLIAFVFGRALGFHEGKDYCSSVGDDHIKYCMIDGKAVNCDDDESMCIYNRPDMDFNDTGEED